MDLVKHEDPWFGIEQEYGLLDADNYPYGWPKGLSLHSFVKIFIF